MIMAVLSQFFDNDMKLLSQIEDMYSVKQFLPGEIILSQEDESDEVFIILDGSVRAFILSTEGNDIWLGDFGPGDLFGEMAAIANISRTSSIYATTTANIAVFSAKNFLSIMRDHGAVGIKVSEILISRVQSTTRRMFELSVLSAPGRIYAEILRLSDDPSGKNTEMRFIEPVPTTIELALKVNSTRETVSRAINSLEKMGLIIREKGRMKIITPEKLGDMIC